MITLTESYRKVHYGLRPAKQVERRMLIDALLLLSEVGFPVRDYKYLGMGSVHFVDFAMFHKYLGIQKMLSVELSSIGERIEFNRPYSNAIETEVGAPVGDFVAKLESDRQHLVWLDYDNVLCKYMLDDISLAVSRMRPGSILLATIDTERPRRVDDGDAEPMSPSEVRAYFEEQAGKYVASFSQDGDFTDEHLPTVILTAVQGAINTGLRGFNDREFLPLFNFLYSDGHQMMTVGGMIAGPKEKSRVRRSRLQKADYARFDLAAEAYWINVPCLTKKEVLYLESKMPAPPDWTPEHGLDPDDAKAFARIYRFFPMYAELSM